MQNEMRPHFDEVAWRLRSLMTGPDDANASADASGRSFGHSSVAASLRHLSRNSTRKANKKEVKGKGLMQRFWVNVVPYLFVDAAALLVLTQPLEVIIPVLPASPSTHDWGRDMKGMGIELAANRLMCDEQKASRIKSSGHRMWSGTCEGFQNRDQCL
jgi:hypothetical protein